MRYVTCVIALSVFALSTPALAQQNHAYAGASIGSSQVDIDGGGVSFDESDIGWKIFGGFDFSAHWAFEGSIIDFGNPSGNVLGVNAEVEADGIDFFGVYKFPVGTNTELFGKGGIIFWDGEVTVTDPGTGLSITDSDDGTDLTLGFGALFGLGGDQFGVRLEFEWFDIDDTDSVYLLSVGGQFNFLP